MVVFDHVIEEGATVIISAEELAKLLTIVQNRAINGVVNPYQLAFWRKMVTDKDYIQTLIDYDKTNSSNL